jgi:hypothetical protein
VKFHNIYGNISAFIAAALFGASVVATRVVVQKIPPVILAVLRFGQGGLVLFLLTFTGVGIVLAERGLKWQGNLEALGVDGLMLLTAL